MLAPHQTHAYGVINTTGVLFPSLYVKLNRIKVVLEAQQGSRPPSHHKRLGSELRLSPAPVTSRGLDKWQVVLKRAPIHSHTELHLSTLLQPGGGVEGCGGNDEAGAVYRVPEHE